MTTEATTTGERADFLESLNVHRDFLRVTVRGLSDEQAALHTTASELCLGGLIKHVAEVESRWVDFIGDGPSAMAGQDGATDWTSKFQMGPEETLAELVERHDPSLITAGPTPGTGGFSGGMPVQHNFRQDRVRSPKGRRWLRRRAGGPWSGRR